MSTQTSNYDADKKAEQRGKRIFKIGGKDFHARKKSNKLMKELIEAVPPTPKGEDTDDNGKPILSPEQEKAITLSNIDIVYAQLGMILRDGEGNPPDDELLEEELDFEDAEGMLQTIMPDAPKAQQ